MKLTVFEKTQYSPKTNPHNQLLLTKKSICSNKFNKEEKTFTNETLATRDQITIVKFKNMVRHTPTVCLQNHSATMVSYEAQC